MQGIRALTTAALTCLGVAAMSVMPPAAGAARQPHAELLFPQFSALGTAVTRDAAGRLVVGGDYSAGVGYAVTRLTPKGKLDRSFGTHGFTRVKIGKSDFGDLTSVAVLPDGRILVNGTVGTDGSQQNGFGTLFGVARLTPKGKLDRSFQESGSIRFTLGQGMDDSMWLTPMPDGRVLVGGDTSTGSLFGCAASFDADFNQTPGFSPLCVVPKGAGAAYFGAAAPDAGGSAVVSVGGMAAGGSGRTPVFGIGRVTSGGQADSAFGDGGFTMTNFGSPAHDGAQVGKRPLVRTPRGWLVGGTTARDFGLVGFTSGGAIDPSFGRGGKLELNVDGKSTRDVLLDLVPLHGGRYLAVGQTEIGGGNRAAGSKLLLAAVTAAGKPVSSFGKHGREVLDARALGVPELDQIDSAVALPDGSVVIVGATHLDSFHGRPAYAMLVLRVKPNGRLAPFG